MLSNEASLLWEACQAARRSCNGRDAKTARLDVEEVEASAMFGSTASIRRLAMGCLEATAKGRNSAARLASFAALARLGRVASFG